MNLRAMLAVTYKVDRIDQKRCPGLSGWKLGHDVDNLIPEKKKAVGKPWMTASELYTT
jgi:hypothetical protein